jgi:hypothetical protein
MSTACQVAGASDRPTMSHQLWTPQAPGEKSHPSGVCYLPWTAATRGYTGDRRMKGPAFVNSSGMISDSIGSERLEIIIWTAALVPPRSSLV